MNKTENNEEYTWVGSQENFVDEVNVYKISHMVLGRFGGNSTAGQYKNEDGCIAWVNEDSDYEFVVLLDAHSTAESAELVVATIQSLKGVLPTKSAKHTLSKFRHKESRVFLR